MEQAGRPARLDPKDGAVFHCHVVAVDDQYQASCYAQICDTDRVRTEESEIAIFTNAADARVWAATLARARGFAGVEFD